MKHAPGIPGLKLPCKHADSVELQPDEDTTQWFNRVFAQFACRLDRVERRVSKGARTSLAAALVPSITYALLHLTSLWCGGGGLTAPVPVPPAHAAQRDLVPQTADGGADGGDAGSPRPYSPQEQ